MNFDLFSQESASVHPGMPTAEDIYAAFPKKKHRIYAITCIKRAMKREHAGHLLERTQAFAAVVATWPAADKPQYIPDASSWFNGGGYDDDPKTWERKGSMKGKAGFA